MSASTGPDRPGNPLRVADLHDLLPRLPELSPLLRLLVSGSRPDASRSWSGSGELGTVGGRLVDAGALSRGALELGAAEAERSAALWARMAAVVEALAEGEVGRGVELLLEQGRSEEAGGRPRAAENWYLAAHGVARDRQSERAPESLRLAARAARACGRLEEAALRYEAAWRSAEDLGREEDVVIAAIGRGNIAVDRGRWGEARTWYGRALDLVGTEGPPRRERWQLFQNLSIVCRRSGALDEARQHLERAAAEGDRLGDEDARVDVGHGWGRLLQAEGDARGAELYYAEALSRATRPVARVTIGANLGEVLLLQGRTLEAAEAARDAEAEAIAAGAVGQLPEVYRLLARVAMARGGGDAFVFLEAALELIRDQELPPVEEALTRELYGELHLSEGDRPRGRAQWEEAVRIYEGLEMENDVARIADRLNSPDAALRSEGMTEEGEDGP